MKAPLADRMRPTSLDDIAGQSHLCGPNGIIRMMLDNNRLTSMIFTGPAGCGKTSVARIIADLYDSEHVFFLNAISASVADIKAIASKKEPSIVFVDEIQYFNSKQQQSLLPFVESGAFTLIASTTDNPYHCVCDALISRTRILEFHPLSQIDVIEHLSRLTNVGGPLDGLSYEVIESVAQICGGDLRRALGMIEMLELMCPHNDLVHADIHMLQRITPSMNTSGFDSAKSKHYEYISALHKSVRGSDPNAALFWLAKLLAGGDILSPARRLLVIASEDVGLAYPDAVPHTLACVQAAERLGLPEASWPLAQATLLLALSPKSSSVGAYRAAMDVVHQGWGASTPLHLSKDNAPGYIWPHDYPNHWIPQQYLPDDLAANPDMCQFYTPGHNSFEQQFATYWSQVKGS